MAETISDQSEGVQKLKAQWMNILQDQEKGFHALLKHNHINLKNCKQCSNISTSFFTVKCNTFLQYTSNFPCWRQQHYMQIFRVNFHSYQIINVETTGRNLFMPLEFKFSWKNHPTNSCRQLLYWMLSNWDGKWRKSLILKLTTSVRQKTWTEIQPHSLI